MSPPSASASSDAPVQPHGSAADPARGDEVDRIIDGWAAARPDLDTAPLEALSRVSRLARRLETARRDVLSTAGLEGWEFDVLTALRRAGTPVTAGQLMHQTLVTSGTMTTRVDKLEARGLVTRARDLADKRAVRISLTDDGARRVDDAMTALLLTEDRMLAPLDPAARSSLATMLRALLMPFEADG